MGPSKHGQVKPAGESAIAQGDGPPARQPHALARARAVSACRLRLKRALATTGLPQAGDRPRALAHARRVAVRARRYLPRGALPRGSPPHRRPGGNRRYRQPRGLVAATAAPDLAAASAGPRAPLLLGAKATGRDSAYRVELSLFVDKASCRSQNSARARNLVTLRVLHKFRETRPDRDRIPPLKDAWPRPPKGPLACGSPPPVEATLRRRCEAAVRQLTPPGDDATFTEEVLSCRDLHKHYMRVGGMLMCGHPCLKGHQ